MNGAELLSYGVIYLRWMVGLILLLASISKAQDIRSFASTIDSFQLLPRQWNKFTAYFIIAIEFIVGASLLLGLLTQVAAIIAIVLFILFATVILINWTRGNIFNCNCFGPYLKGKIGGKAVLRNLMLITLCLVILQFYDGYFALESIWWSDKVALTYPIEHFALLTAIILAIITSCIIVKEVMRNHILLETKQDV